MRRRLLLTGGVGLTLAACAGPALTTYTLSLPPAAAPEAPLGPRPLVIAVSPILLPAEIDSTDLIVRDGSVLRRSLTGRWGSRLSVAMTTRLAERLAARYPRALVTTVPLSDAPGVSVRINVSRLDIATDGSAVLDADWVVVPRDARAPERRQRVRVAVTGPVASDADIVALTATLVDRLAADIDLGVIR